MPLLSNILEKGFYGLITDPPKTPAEYARRFSTFYEQFAMTATPPPVTAGKRPLLEAALAAAFASPIGAPPTGIAGINQGLLAFWIGTPVPGGAVIAFLGAPVLAACLIARLSNPKIGAQQAAKGLAQCHTNATKLVQYLIPPGPPAFLV